MRYPTAERMWIRQLGDLIGSTENNMMARAYLNSMPTILNQDPKVLKEVFRVLSEDNATLDNSISRLSIPLNPDFTKQAMDKIIAPYSAPTGSPVNMNTPTSLQTPVNPSPTQFNITNPEKITKLPKQTSQTVAAKSSKGLKGWFSKVNNNLKKGKPLINAKGPNFQNIKDFRNNLLGARIWENGPKVSTAANAINAGVQGVQALKGLYDNSQTDTDISDLKQDIRELKLSNPMYANNLTPDQLKTLRKLDSGTQGADLGDALEGGLKGIPSALFGALTGGLSGGIPGALIGGLGSLVNSGIEGYGKAQQEQMAELQGLYDALNQGYSDYRNMKRPSGLYTGGLQSRYRGMYN